MNYFQSSTNLFLFNSFQTSILRYLETHYGHFEITQIIITNWPLIVTYIPLILATVGNLLYQVYKIVSTYCMKKFQKKVPDKTNVESSTKHLPHVINYIEYKNVSANSPEIAAILSLVKKHADIHKLLYDEQIKAYVVLDTNVIEIHPDIYFKKQKHAKPGNNRNKATHANNANNNTNDESTYERRQRCYQSSGRDGDDDYYYEEEEQEEEEQEEEEKSDNRHHSQSIYYTFSFRIFSKSKTLAELQAFVATTLEQFQVNVECGVNDRLCILRGPYHQYENVTFRHCDFLLTYRSFDNLFGKEIHQVRQQILEFEKSEQEYQRLGKPYTFGMLFHGPPGTGKTSLIKAISKETRRHIIRLQITNQTDADILRSFLTNENVILRIGNENHHVTIPMERRLYVFEEIDAGNEEFLFKRKQVKKKKKKKNKKKNTKKNTKKNKKRDEDEDEDEEDDEEEEDEEDEEDEEEEEEDEEEEEEEENDDDKRKKPCVPGVRLQEYSRLTLGDVLEILDGIVEMPKRMIIFTSNHPERLDPALLRPGRIDINIKLDYCDRQQVIDIFEFHFLNRTDILQGVSVSSNLPEFDRSLVKLSSAELQQLCSEWKLLKLTANEIKKKLIKRILVVQ